MPPNHPMHRHCFTLGMEDAKRWLDPFPNLYMGLTPFIVDKPPWHEVIDFVKKCPLDRILIETDAPYFLPPQVRSATESFNAYI